MINVLIFVHIIAIPQASRPHYKDTPTDRCSLVEFLLYNGWFEGTYVGGDLSIPWDEEREERLRFWLKAYGLPAKERYDLLLQKGSETIPYACNAFHSFAEKDGCPLRSRVYLLDFLVNSMEKDLPLLNQEDVEHLLVESNGFLNLSHRKILADFIGLQPELKTNLEFRYTAVKKSPYKQDVSAYPMEWFRSMGQLVFGEESWKQNHLMEKALNNKRIASMLAVLALHFFTAIRFQDMLRLPKPRLTLMNKDLAADLMAGTVSKADLEGLVANWELEISSFHRAPAKTAGCRENPEIKVLVPVSLKEPFGRILALAALHCGDNEEAWLYPGRITKKDLDTIFDVMKWPEAGKSFSTRRANKAFLQGIQLVCVNGVVDAYLVAALFRGHSGSLGKLPPTTSIYLKDHAFSGKTSEAILFQLFERGTMGFVLTLLLERIDKDAYRSLSMEAQTQLIQGIGLEPAQAENVVRSVMQAQDRAKELLSEIFSVAGVDTMEETVTAVLEKIALGAAPAKQDHLYCVRIAAGQACPYQDRSSCLGCGAEVYTRSSFCLMVKEYVALVRKIRKAKGSELVRLNKVLEDGVLTAIAQMLESLRILGRDESLDFYYTILERGMQLVSGRGSV